MGLKASFAIAAATILGPILALAGYRQWLNTRTWTPLDIPISLSRGHIRTPHFYINLTGEYDARLNVDYVATYTPGCPDTAWRSLQTHSAAFENGVNIGETDGPRWGSIGRLTVDKKGIYSLDLEVRSDGSCLNAFHPRLRVQNTSDFPYDFLYEVGVWAIPLTIAAGLGLIVLSLSFARRSAARSVALVESCDPRVPIGLPFRKRYPGKLISGFPHFPLICATVLVFLVNY